MNSEQTYDLVIIGAGVSGAAQYFAAAKYTNIKKVLLVEKETAPGKINSAATNNSQTLHEGDIETNYNLAKAQTTKYKANFTRQYLEKHNNLHGKLFIKGPKMVFGVGAKEVAFLKERYQEFKDLFSTLEEIGATQLEQKEPMMMAGRADKNVIALYNKDGLTVNYAVLAEQLINDANEAWLKDSSRSGEVRFLSKASNIQKIKGGYSLEINQETIRTRYLSVCAGAHSMYFAKQLGIKEVATVSLLLVAGNFYYTPKFLHTKVYTLQDPGLPFAAVHADPDILYQNDKNRYGPTTRLVTQLERGRFGTTIEYLAAISPLFGSLFAYLRILSNKKFLIYAIKHNLFFTIPFLGNYLFVRTARKIIPTLRYQDLTRARGQGGVRPQIVRYQNKQPLDMGEAKFRGEQSFFNVTPSPGASTAIYNGLVDIRDITKSLGAQFNDAAVAEEFKTTLH